MKTIFIACLFLISSVTLFSQCLTGGCQNGYGIFKIENGDIYYGYFSNGRFEGIGIYEGVNGDVFQGEFKQGVFNGVGKYKWKNKASTVGSYTNGVAQGVGVYMDQKGATACYNWNQGKVTSEVTSASPSNNPEECEGNCIDGYGRLLNGNNGFIQAHFIEGKAVVGIISNSGSTYYGGIKNNQPDGFGILESSIDTFIGPFKDGKKDGEGIRIGMMGDKFEEKWNNGVLEEKTFEFNQSFFQKELQKWLDRSTYQILHLPRTEDIGSDKYYLKFLDFFEISLNQPIVGEYYMVRINFEALEAKITKEQLVKALNGISYLKKSGDTYSYRDKTIEISDSSFIGLTINYPE